MKETLLILLFFCSLGYTLNAQNIEYEQTENTHRIMSYNIRHAKGMDEKLDFDRIANIIKTINPEIVALQEVDSMARRSGSVDILSILGNITGMHHNFSASIPFDGGTYGIGILSKEPPLLVKRYALPGVEEPRSLLVVELEKYVLCCTHLSLTESDQLASIEIINDIVSEYNKPVFLVGDLNALPQSDTMTKLSLNWQILNDSTAKTFPADNPTETLDYILGYQVNGRTYRVDINKVVPEKVASDHRPIFADILISE